MRTKCKTVPQFDSSFKTLHTWPKGGSIHTEIILNMQERHMLYVLAMFTKEY